MINIRAAGVSKTRPTSVERLNRNLTVFLEWGSKQLNCHNYSLRYLPNRPERPGTTEQSSGTEPSSTRRRTSTVGIIPRSVEEHIPWKEA
jgi:hypothetical protein